MDDETIEESKIKPDVCDFNLVPIARWFLRFDFSFLHFESFHSKTWSIDNVSLQSFVYSSLLIDSLSNNLSLNRAQSNNGLLLKDNIYTKLRNNEEEK